MAVECQSIYWRWIAGEKSCRHRIISSHTGYEMKVKRDYEKAVRTTISMPPELHRIAVKTQEQQCFSTFSDYIQSLIRRANGQTQEAATR